MHGALLLLLFCCPLAFEGCAEPKGALPARQHRSFAHANTQAILSTGLRSHQIPVEGFRDSLAGGDAWALMIPREGLVRKGHLFRRNLYNKIHLLLLVDHREKL